MHTSDYVVHKNEDKSIVDQAASTAEPHETHEPHEREHINMLLSKLLNSTSCLSRNAAEFLHGATQASETSRTLCDFIASLNSMQDLVTCPLSLRCMCNPMKTPERHSFSKHDITIWLSSNSSCPLTRKHLSVSDLVRDDDLERIIMLVFSTEVSDKDDTHTRPPDYDDDDDDDIPDLLENFF